MPNTKQPRPQGRMTRVTIAGDAGINRLSDGAARLYFMLKPHLDSYGKFLGGPHLIKEHIVPLLPWSAKRINGYLVEINNATSVRVWRDESRCYMQDLTFSSEQDIREDRRGRDIHPTYPGPKAMIPDISTNQLPEVRPDWVPDLVPPEVEVKFKKKLKLKSGTTLPPDASGASADRAEDQIPDYKSVMKKIGLSNDPTTTGKTNGEWRKAVPHLKGEIAAGHLTPKEARAGIISFGAMEADALEHFPDKEEAK